jgi:hypothetical protein
MKSLLTLRTRLGAFFLVWIHSSIQIKALGHHDRSKPNNNPVEMGRRDWARRIAIATSGGGAVVGGLGVVEPAQATGLAAKLASKDPSALSNSVFNVPPTAQVYPEFMRGHWKVQIQFAGFLFPSTKISKQRITQNVLIPGFQKCSIAAICDVGKDASYEMRIDPTTGFEDRVATLTSQIQGFLGYDAVQEILYQPKSNPNRISIDFVDYQTKNAERIELFINARDSELVPETGVFVCSETMRQVTFGTGTEVGIPRQVVGNYAHFWTWRPGDNKDTLKGNLLTAAYLDPQDPMFFEEPSKPVAVYSHILTATRIVAAI